MGLDSGFEMIVVFPVSAGGVCICGDCRVRAVLILDRFAFKINSLRGIAGDFSGKEWTFRGYFSFRSSGKHR